MPIFAEGNDPRFEGTTPFRGNVVPNEPEEPMKLEERPNFVDETLPAALRTTTSYMALKMINDSVNGKASPTNFDPNFNPLKAAEGTPLEGKVDRLAGVANKDQFDAMLKREMDIHNDRKTLEASGWPGTVASVGAGLVDPGLFLIPGAIGPKALSMTARMALGGAAVGAVDAGVRTAYDRNRTLGDNAMTIGLTTAAGGVLGKAIGFLTKDELAHTIDSIAVENGIKHYSQKQDRVIGDVSLNREVTPYTPEQVQAALAERPENPYLLDDAYEAVNKGEPYAEVLQKQKQYERDYRDWWNKHADNIDQIKAEYDAGVQGNSLSPPTPEEVNNLAAGEAQSVSAAKNTDPYASAEGRSFKQKEGVWGSKHLINALGFLSPIGRVFKGEGLAAKKYTAELTETAREFDQSLEGLPTSQHGGAIETTVNVKSMRNNMTVRDAARDGWLKHLHGEAGGVLQGVKSDIQSLAGGLLNGKLTYSQFKAEISKALRSGDKNEAFPEAAEAARTIRENVIKPIEEELKTLTYSDGTPMLDPNAVAPKGDESFYSRMWNLPVIRSRQQELRGKIVNWLKEEQDYAAAARERIMAHSDREVELGQHIDKLENGLLTIEKRVNETGIRLSERGMAVRDNLTGAERIQERLNMVEELASEMQQAIDYARSEFKNPEKLEYIADLERQLKEIRREAAPMSEAEQARIEKAEADNMLTGKARKAAMIVTGQHKMPEAPSFLGWMASEGGIEDAAGNVKWQLGKNVPVGFYRKGRNLFPKPGQKPTRGLDDWGEFFAEEAKEGGMGGGERLTPNEVMDIIHNAQSGNYPSWWKQGQDYDALTREVEWLQNAIEEAGAEPKSINELMDIIREGGDPLLQRLEEKAQAAGEKGVLEGALGNARGEQLETKRFISKLIKDRNVKQSELSGLEAGKRGIETGTRKSLGRQGLLQKRLEHHERMRDMTQQAIAFAEKMKGETRAAMEKEIEGWHGNSAKEAIAALAKRREKEAAREAEIKAKEEELQSKLGPNGRLPKMAAPNRTPYRSADKAVNKAIRRIVNSEKDYDINELGDRADEIIDRILGTPDGRFNYDIANPKYATPGSQNNSARMSLRSRDFAIPTNLVQDFVHNDVEHVMGSYLRTILPDMEMVKRFGDVEMEAQMKEIAQEYNDKINGLTGTLSGRKLEKETARLNKEKTAMIRDVAAMRDRVRNTFGWTGSANESFFHKLAANIRNYTTLTTLGNVTLNSLADFGGQAVMRYGGQQVFGDQLVPFAKALANPELRKLTREQAREFGIGVETVLGQSRHNINDLVHNYMPEDRFSYGLAMATDKFQQANLLGPWTDLAKLASFPIAQGNFIRLCEKVAAGKATQREVGELASASIDQGLARKIASELGTHSKKDMGIRWANTSNWTDKAAKQAFENAVHREVNILVVTPGKGETPLMMSTWWGSVLGQFRGFMMGANERVMIANLQRGQATMLQGAAAMTGLGMMSYMATQLVKGEEVVPDNPWMLLKEGIDRGSVAPVINDIMKTASKATGGATDPFSLVGAGAPVSRRAQNSSLADLAGPAFSTAEHAYQFGKGAARSALGGDAMTRAELHHGRLATVGQNLFYFRGMLNHVEDATGDWMGMPEKRDHHKKAGWEQ